MQLAFGLLQLCVACKDHLVKILDLLVLLLQLLRLAAVRVGRPRGLVADVLLKVPDAVLRGRQLLAHLHVLLHACAREPCHRPGRLAPGRQLGTSDIVFQAGVTQALLQAKHLLPGLALQIILLAVFLAPDLLHLSQGLGAHLRYLPAELRLALEELMRLLPDVLVQHVHPLLRIEGLLRWHRLRRLLRRPSTAPSRAERRVCLNLSRPRG
mmetsp:Transcript_4532/g.9233  ORF Transcript_4532/g.9233 Transcript_4532/m.9233 type:complete len:211 (-) Transcript_4532:652-1284(-)